MNELDEINSDFNEFMDSAPKAPPYDLKKKIFFQVHQDLNPNAWFIFSKISLIHLLVGFVTLSLCPQFGLRVFGEGLGFMKLFISLGTYGCAAICGAFFVGSSLLASAFFLRFEELKVLKNHYWLQISALTFLSLGAFIMAGADILLSFAVVWLLGSVVGGIVMLELGRKLKYYIKSIEINHESRSL